MEKGLAHHLQFKGRFISFESGLMLIDQHRAHVRVLFDRYMNQIRQKQGCLRGVVPGDRPVAGFRSGSVGEPVGRFGGSRFRPESFLGGSYAINGIPSGIEGLNPVELVRNMVHTAMEKGSDVKEEVRTILALTLARAAAIVYGRC